MRSVTKWIGTIACAFIAMANAAQAQTAGGYLLTQGTPITISGWTIVLDATGTGPSTCGASGSGSCATTEVIPTVNNTALGITLSLVFEGSTGGAFQTSLSGGAGSDISIGTILVTAPGGLQIYTASANLVASPSTFHISVGDLITDGGTILPQLSTNASLSPTLQSTTFAPNNALSVATDFRAGTSLFPVATMTSATLTFSAASEPVSSSLLAVGLGALGFVHRKRRRNA